MSENKIINIMLDPGHGRCDVRTMEAEASGRYPELPKASRKGYVFEGWFLSPGSGDEVRSGEGNVPEENVILYAHWTRDTAKNTSIIAKKKKGSLHRQRVAVIALAVAVILLVGGLIATNYFVQIYNFEDLDGTQYNVKKVDGRYTLQYKNGEMCGLSEDGKYYITDLGTMVYVDTESGECEIYAVVDTEGTETLGYGNRVLLFKQLTYDASSTNDESRIISSIEIHNESGTYTMKKYSSTSSRFYIEGKEHLTMKDETMAEMSSACGYTLSMMRLEDPVRLEDNTIDFSEYGLAAETRTKIEIDENGNEVEVEYEYTPAWYKITTENGDSYTVYIGDPIVSEAGHYVRYGDRDTVYVLSAVGKVLNRLEDIVTPMLVYPMSMNSYFDVSNFKIYTDIDHDAIDDKFLGRIGEAYEVNFDDMSNEEIAEFLREHQEDEKMIEVYAKLYEEYSRVVCNFSYWDLAEREDSMYSSEPYKSHIEYSKGYYINGTTIDSMLYNIYAMSFVELTKLAPSDEDLEKYGLDKPMYSISYVYNTTDDEGEYVGILNNFEISKKNEDGTYYAYSDTYDMVVCVDEQFFDFLELEEDAWYDPQYVQLDISYITDIFLESPKFDGHFVFDNTASLYGNYSALADKVYTDKNKNAYLTQKGEDGKYVLVCGDKIITPVFDGDYLVMAQAYRKGTNNAEAGYSFAEYEGVDENDDNVYDYFIYYYYVVHRSQTTGKYTLSASMAKIDLSGNIISKQTVEGKSAFYTEYFTTKSGYVFLTAENSYLGQVVTNEYESVGRGEWHSGNVFVSNDGDYIIVDEATGEWGRLGDGLSSDMYIGDRYTNRINLMAATTADLPTRPSETYYPTGTNKIRYNEETTKIEVYKGTKGWENATYDDCTLGFWCAGATYATSDGTILVVNKDTGDIGVVKKASAGSENAVVSFENDTTEKHLLNYTFNTTSSSGLVTERDATYNFRQLYKGMLYGSFEGVSELSDEEIAKLQAIDDSMFTTDSDPSNPCVLKITILAKDPKGTVRNVVYRFYRYTERKTLLTIEMLDEDGNSVSEGHGYGKFYVVSTFPEKIISDAQKVVNGTPVSAEGKY